MLVAALATEDWRDIASRLRHQSVSNTQRLTVSNQTPLLSVVLWHAARPLKQLHKEYVRTGFYIYARHVCVQASLQMQQPTFHVRHSQQSQGLLRFFVVGPEASGLQARLGWQVKQNCATDHELNLVQGCISHKLHLSEHCLCAVSRTFCIMSTAHRSSSIMPS